MQRPLTLPVKIPVTLYKTNAALPLLAIIAKQHCLLIQTNKQKTLHKFYTKIKLECITLANQPWKLSKLRANWKHHAILETQRLKNEQTTTNHRKAQFYCCTDNWYIYMHVKIGYHGMPTPWRLAYCMLYLNSYSHGLSSTPRHAW